MRSLQFCAQYNFASSKTFQGVQPGWADGCSRFSGEFDLALGAGCRLGTPGLPPGMRRPSVELMTSGEFARASGLSRKALRLYDELGLLHPAQVAPATQYRLYAPAQLEQARLVAWLRRLGMPLATIRSVSVLPRAQAAAESASYWRRGGAGS